MKVVLSGIGGVGGYFGGLLAKHFFQSDVEIFFIARGENERMIRNNGLKMQTGNGNFTAYPFHVGSNPAEIGVADLLFCCTKGYDLESAMTDCKPCIGSSTVLLPLLNGVDAGERIRKIYPGTEIWDGCVYLVSRLAEPGLVRETGNTRKLFFGSQAGTQAKLQQAESLFREANIDATWSANIRETVWEKFLFLSPMATLTSYLDKSISAVFADHRSEKLLQHLVVEVKELADAKGIFLPEHVTQKNLDVMRSLPPETTTSMHSDFRKGGRTELETLTGYVIRSAAEYSIRVPTYEMIYEKLKKRSS